MNWKLSPIWTVGAVAVAAGLIAISAPRFASGADHIDSPAAQGTPLADANDLFAWVDSGNLNLALTVGGLSAPAMYDNSVVYVFHIDRGDVAPTAGLPATPNSSEVRCQFADGDTFECWLIDNSDSSVVSYVTGDTDVEAGVASAENMRVFAGLRNDAFVFEFEGFTDAVTAVRDARATGEVLDPAAAEPNAYDDNGCVLVEGSPFDNDVGTTSADNAVVDLLTSSPPPAGSDVRSPADDTFAAVNSQTIVVQLPLTIVPGQPSGSDDFISAWASTHQAQ